MKVKIVNKSQNPLPSYATEFSAGVDLYANIEQEIQLQPLERKLFPTGIFIEIPSGYEAQIRPRSGMALKKGITVLNSPGTIDSDYRGEVGVILVNLSNQPVTIEPSERICQMVIAKHEVVEFVETTQLEQSARGAGGFGHTGIK